MVLTLYDLPKSPCLVGLVLKEKKVPFTNQPFKQVPYIDDDGFILYEARAIARYLIKKYPNQGTTGLIPTSLKEEALFEQASSVEIFNYDPHAARLVTEKVYKKIRGLEPDEAKASESLGKLGASLDVYDGILGKQKYLAGDSVTLADLQHLPYGTTLFDAGHGDALTKRPNVARWWNDIYNRPAWLAVKDGIEA